MCRHRSLFPNATFIKHWLWCTSRRSAVPRRLGLRTATGAYGVASTSFCFSLWFVLTITGGLSAQTVVDTVNIGANPGPIAVNPVTNKIYVANTVPAGEGAAGSVTVIDGVTDSTSTISLSEGIADIAVNSATNKIYVASCGDLACDGFVAVIDGNTNGVTWVTVGTGPTGVAVNSVTNKIYVRNNDNTVTVIDGATNNTSTVGVGYGSYGSQIGCPPIAVNPVTNKVYVANERDSTVTVIDGSTNTTTTISGVGGAFAIAVNPATNKIYVTGGGVVTVIDGNTNNATAISGIDSDAVAINAATDKIYVTSNGVNLAVIDGATNSVTTIAGTGGQAVAVNPVADQIYVVNNGGNVITVVDGSTNTTSTVPVGNSPLAVAVNQNTNRVYVVNQADGTVSVIALLPTGLAFPVKQDNTYCTRNGMGDGQCTPTTARIAAVFDHEMKTAYETDYRYDKMKGQCVPKKKPAGYGTIIDFENEPLANLSPLPGPFQGYGVCETLYGYTNATGSSYLSDLNYQGYPGGNGYLWYDSHPGYDYPFDYDPQNGKLTGVYPAISGCVSYKISAAGASYGAYHVLSITPLSTEPQGGVCPANVASETGYVVFYLHLSSYLSGKKPVYCQTPINGSAKCQKQIACPNCPAEGQWVSVNASQPIAYVGDFSNGKWGGVSPHLHFEVDDMPNRSATPIPIDPYGWCGPPGSDPYPTLTGHVNTNLWGTFQYTCPGAR